MGKKIYQSLKEYDYNITGFDIFAKNRKNVITKIEDINIEGYDWLVDFSEANISKEITKLFLTNGKNVISGTTGLTFDELNDFCILAKNNDAKYINRVNFAKSFCEFEAIAKKIAQKMDHNILIESHDFKKLDKPSGSALRLMRVLKLKSSDILAIRGDEPNPYHSLISSNKNERIIITHQILDKNAFVEGFLEVFLKEAGV